MKEIRSLTSLRAFAAFLVFMFHYAWVYSPANRGVTDFAGEWIPLELLWRQGNVGVSVFFVLSGFLISRIYFDPIAARTASLRLFFVKRVARIWPLFLVYGVIQHVVLVQQGETPGSGMWVTLTMTQGFFADLWHAGLPTAWSLTVEESFYAFAPLLYVIVGAAAFVPAGEAPDRRWWRLGAVLLGVTAGLVLVGEALGALARSEGWTWHGFLGSRWHVWHATLFGRMPEFAIGAFAAFLHRSGRVEAWFAGRRAVAVVIAGFVGGALCMAGKTFVVDASGTAAQAATYVLAYGISGFTALLILGLTVEGSRLHRFLGWGPFVYLGKISYGFYLIQITVMIAPLVALTDRLGPARLPVLFVLTNLACAVSYELVEKPARSFIVSRWGGRR